MQEIGAKAQGVFLWVYLVVRSLVRGLANRDEIHDLEQRLNELLSDLEEYFKHMMDTIESVYHVQTARIFKTLITAGATLPLVAFHYLDVERVDPHYALGTGLPPLSADEAQEIQDKKIWQLNARCKDLHVSSTQESSTQPSFLASHWVGFLHRTVVDFLRTKSYGHAFVPTSRNRLQPAYFPL
jgi:hypothetical protein